MRVTSAKAPASWTDNPWTACSVCIHDNRDTIERALVVGVPLSKLAREHQCSESALRRHRDKHLSPRLIAAAEVMQQDKDESLVDELRELQQRTKVILNTAEKLGDLRTATSAIVAACGNLELMAKLLHQIDDRQSSELFKKAMEVYRTAGRPVSVSSATTLWLELENLSRIISLPGSEATVRGFSSVNLLIVDEASRVDDTLYHSIRPMLAVSQGRLIAVSTPAGRRGWWYSAWTSSEDWLRFEIPVDQCPQITPAFLRDEERALGPRLFQQEYYCTFAESEISVFSLEDLEAIRIDAPERAGGWLR